LGNEGQARCHGAIELISRDRRKGQTGTTHYWDGSCMLSGPMPVATGDDFAHWVRCWRHANRWTQERLAEALGYEVSYVAKIERGQRRVSRQFVARLAEVVAVDIAQLEQMARRPTAKLRLPVPTGGIVGREQEIGELSALLGSDRCVTLVGAPGIGKTALALEIAWRIGENFRHGACFVGLADVSSAASVASSVVHSLGLSERGAPRLEDLLFGALRHQELLLVLDNFEHVLDARTFVADLIGAAPEVRILLTSREALGVACETSYCVRPLKFPAPGDGVPDDLEDYPAVRVFVERSRLVRQDFVLSDANASSVMDICARLAGVPLAITLTAKASRLLSPADIARGLDARLELDAGSEGEPLGHNRLDAALDWSWALLPEAHRALLASMGVFNGGCSIAAAEAVCSEVHEDVLPALGALDRKSLIEVHQVAGGASRFVCLEPIRRYALAKLQEGGLLQDVRARHCEYFLSVAEVADAQMTAGDHQSEAWRTLEAEHSNLASAFEWALEASPPNALRLGAALWRFYSLRRISEGRRWLTLALARGSAEPIMRARALNGLAILARAQGDLDLAEASLAEVCALAVVPEGRRELAFARLTQGIVAQDRALYDVADTRFADATALYGEIGDERGIGHGMNCLGVVALRRGDIVAASDRFHAALALFRKLGDRWSVAVTATNLGWIAEHAGELGEARDWYEETDLIWEQAGDEHGRGRSLVSLGRLARLQRRFADARRLLEEALDIFHRFGDRRLAAACLGQLADVAYERRRFDVAGRLLGAARALREGLGTPAWAEEAALEDRVLGLLRDEVGAAPVERAYAMGATLTIEDVVEMVHADGWPPVRRRGGAGRVNGAARAG